MNRWYQDPLLVKEFRTRLRARTATIVVLLQALLLCGIAGMLFLTHYGDTAWELGKNFYHALLYIQTMALFFLAPLVAASVISSEIEQKTYDSLLVTPVTPKRIVLAKLASALGVFLVLLAMALPFAVAGYLLGGVGLDQLVLGWGYVALLTAVSGVMGLYWSTRFDRSIASIPAAAVCTVLAGVLFPIMASDGPALLSRISPLLFLRAFTEQQTMPFFGESCPVWMPVFLLLALCGCAFTAAAVERVKPAENRRYLYLRGFSWLALMTLAVGTVAEIAGPDVAPTATAAREILSRAIITLLAPLCLMAPWFGASIPVIRSERCNFFPLRRPGLTKQLALLMTSPFGYILILSISAGTLLFVSRHMLELASDLPGNAFTFISASLIICPATYAMLSYRLADRRRTRNRFIGLTVAALLAGVMLLGPLVAFFISRGGLESTTRPLWLHLYALTSPFTQTTLYAMPRQLWATSLSSARAALGEAGIWALAPALHGVLLLILLLPVYPSWTKRLAADQTSS